MSLGLSEDGAKLIGWGCLPVPFATAAVCLRFVSRLSGPESHLGADDWCMLAALTLYYGLYISLAIWGPVGKIGWHEAELTHEELETFLKIHWCVVLFYGLVGPVVKLSILLLYRRIFTTVKWFMWTTLAVFILVACWGVSRPFTAVLRCTPIGSIWQPQKREHCVDTRDVYFANGLLNLAFDCVILALPIPVIWSLHMSKRKRFSLNMLFLLGAFVCIMSILRIAQIREIDSNDLSGTLAIPSIWTSLEAGFAIVTGSIPTLPLLFQRWKKTLDEKWQRSRLRQRVPRCVVSSHRAKEASVADTDGARRQERDPIRKPPKAAWSMQDEELIELGIV